MDFVRSRLALVGLLVAWPCAQLVGCAVKDREYGPASEGGAGGTDSTSGGTGAKGGTSGKGSGGSTGSGATGGTEGGMAGDMSNASGGTDTGAGGSRGGTSTSGGTGGSRGGTTSAGGSSNGGTDSSGGAGEAGASGEAGMGGAGNPTGGTGGTTTTCVPTGTTETCADGIDNDCDGVTDCLTLTSEFPSKTGAASGTDVSYTFAAHASTATFQCRNTHGTTPAGSFGTCGTVSGNVVQPFSAAFAQAASNDGLWTTEVRLHFPDGGASAAYRRTVYVHHTLYGVTRCPATTTAQAYADFAKAQDLEDAGIMDQTNVKSPFVQVTFTPPVNATFNVGASDGVVNWMTLRRNFAFSSDGHYMVMTRNYTSRNTAGMGCYAAVKRTHVLHGDRDLVAGADTYQACTALVFNKKGAGMCLSWSGTAITNAEYPFSSAQIPSTTYSPVGDNFAWRKLTASIGGVPTNFSPKCDTAGCATGYTTYLPDKAFFPYFAN